MAREPVKHSASAEPGEPTGAGQARPGHSAEDDPGAKEGLRWQLSLLAWLTAFLLMALTLAWDLVMGLFRWM